MSATLLDKPTTETDMPPLNVAVSEGFVSWLKAQQLSFAFSTHQAGKLFCVGRLPSDKLALFERTFEQAMGLFARDDSLYLATRAQLWRFVNALQPGQQHEGHDALYVPQMSSVTGDLDVHDLAVDSRHILYFVNTLFSCVAEASATHSFRTVWQPPFISQLWPEDRCHLNGLALDGDMPAFVTMVAQTDTKEGWREQRIGGGLVMDIRTNAVIADGLSMPHSPRLHQGRVWFLNSGTGQLMSVDAKGGKAVEVCFCPGYARGLAMVGDYAIVGLSKPREGSSFADLPLAQELKKRNQEPLCGILVINHAHGLIEHQLTLEGVVQEIYDVVALPGLTRPMAVGFKTPDVRRIISIEP